MVMPEFHPNKIYSYKDYLTWSNDERWELIGGIPYNMSPAPLTRHQEILSEMTTEFGAYLRGKSCQSFVSPFDVRLFTENRGNDSIHDVVQPDLTVVCDPKKIDKNGCTGSPDLVVEILSPSTAKKDKTTKRDLYEKAKVKEYWIVDPENEFVEVFILKNDDKYEFPDVYSDGDHIKVRLFTDLEIDLDVIFGNNQKSEKR